MEVTMSDKEPVTSGVPLGIVFGSRAGECNSNLKQFNILNITQKNKFIFSYKLHDQILEKVPILLQNSYPMKLSTSACT
ncbi:hypothetical protein DPMN_086638 [Dreissena polymorpha]|uniref:Uncharacterized protein n=1 Tax=Dreissena polymorpha TaxID=45954 RepID=A0A9D4QW55_DREPO|nr:hypothetical protein DPMN_086638 [Dreissena polymorpha]